MHRQSKVDWSELPQELLTKITTHLQSPSDIYRFHLVCKKWHSSFPSSPTHLLSYSLPSLPPILNPSTTRPIFLIARNVYLIKPLNQTTDDPIIWVVTVEELHPGKLRLLHPVTNKPISTRYDDDGFPNPLDVSAFSLSLISGGVRICYDDGDENVFDNDFGVRKVVIVSNDCSGGVLFVYLLSKDGKLIVFRVGSKEFSLCEEGCRFVDIVRVKERVYALDCDGNLYYVFVDDKGTIVKKRVCGGGGGVYPGRIPLRLGVSGDALYLIVLQVNYKVFRLNARQCKWDELESFERILVVTPDDCFFFDYQNSSGWCLGNCILLPKDIFFGRGMYIACERDYGVFFLDDVWDRNNLNVLRVLPLSKLFWPPPTWIRSCPFSYGSVSKEAENKCIGAETSFPSTNSVENMLAFEDEMDKEEVPNQSNINLHSVSTSPLQVVANKAPLVKFEGVDVSSHVVPILNKIWNKHGNILQGSLVSSKGLLTWALESLAKMVLIIESNSGKSLIDTDAEFLGSTLRDLQLIRLKLDWLAPSINHGLEQRRIMLGLESKKSDLLAELLVVEERLAGQNKLLAESLSVSRLLD